MAIIGLDATDLSVHGKGISRYQYGLIESLSRLDRKNSYYIFLNKKYILPRLPEQNNFHYVRIYKPKRIIWEQVQIPALIRKYKLQIYHSASDTLPFMSKAKFLLSLFEIPDYRIELSQRNGDNSLYIKLSQRYNKFFFSPSLKKAKVVIASSNFTKKDLIQKYFLNEEKIRVIYPGIQERFCPANNSTELINIRKKYNVEGGYILHISSSDPRDNTAAVIRAYYIAQNKLKFPQKLIILGDTKIVIRQLEKLATELNLRKNVIFMGRLPENELVELYQAADLYLDPSFFEGFGFQVVEAMACGIPVITSKVSSLPEIIDDAGIFVDPTDIDGMASVLLRVISDAELRQSLRRKGLARARYFSWEKCARETLAIYYEFSDNL